MTMTEQKAQPPAGYHPDGAGWVDDQEDPFYTPAEERPWVADPASEPTKLEVRAVYEGRREVTRVVRAGKGYRWAPPIVNQGNLAALRPTSPDRVTVDLDDPLHFKVWAHHQRRRWAQGHLRAAEESERRAAAQPRCPICRAPLALSTPAFRPWSKGKGLCMPCSEAVNLLGAEQHLEQHRAEVTSWLQSAR